MSSSVSVNERVIRAAQAIAYALEKEGQKYAIVGGAAIALLGSQRETHDADVVVLRNQTRAVKNILKAHTQYFRVESGTRHTQYLSTPPVEVDVLTPPALFRETFEATTQTYRINEAEILDPRLLLNAKCGAIRNRASEGKKVSDIPIELSFSIAHFPI
jgi:hypothetical protein